MIIRSQDGKKIAINPKNIFVDSGLNRHWLYADNIIMGSYTAESIAIEELDEIEKAMNRGQKNYEVRKDY
jgi:hypothetical protein